MANIIPKVRSLLAIAKCKPVRLVLIASVVVVAWSSASGQISRPVSDPLSSIGADKGSPDSGEIQRNSMAEEMRIKREIKSAEKDHQQNLERAKEASSLGKELADSFKKDNQLDQEDLKKLEKLEKLAKRIRSEAGGSDDEPNIEKHPSNLVEAMDCVAKVANSLNEKVQETPRQVVSTSIINKANVLLELIRIVRTFNRKV